jgi:hypothetical protein
MRCSPSFSSQTPISLLQNPRFNLQITGKTVGIRKKPWLNEYEAVLPKIATRWHLL